MLIEIDAERCVGCGKCVADCVGSNLAVEDGIAQVKGRCILCGRCVAVCPTAAVSIPGYDMADVVAGCAGGRDDRRRRRSCAPSSRAAASARSSRSR